MNRLLPNLKSFAALFAIAAVVCGAARAADLSEPIILVASSLLDRTPFNRPSSSLRRSTTAVTSASSSTSRPA